MAFAFTSTPADKLTRKFALFSFINHSFLDNGQLNVTNYTLSSFFK